VTISQLISISLDYVTIRRTDRRIDRRHAIALSQYRAFCTMCIAR